MLLTILCVWVAVSLFLAAAWSLSMGRLRHRRSARQGVKREDSLRRWEPTSQKRFGRPAA
jgi:hypothetical protein